MSRLVKLVIALFILGGCLIFATALAGGLMDDSAFTQSAWKAGH